MCRRSRCFFIICRGIWGGRFRLNFGHWSGNIGFSKDFVFEIPVSKRIFNSGGVGVGSFLPDIQTLYRLTHVNGIHPSISISIFACASL